MIPGCSSSMHEVLPQQPNIIALQSRLDNYDRFCCGFTAARAPERRPEASTCSCRAETVLKSRVLARLNIEDRRGDSDRQVTFNRPTDAPLLDSRIESKRYRLERRSTKGEVSCCKEAIVSPVDSTQHSALLHSSTLLLLSSRAAEVALVCARDCVGLSPSNYIQAR